MSAYYEKMTTFLDLAHQKNGTHAYAAGYLSSLAANMVAEMRRHGQIEMADHFERQLTGTITDLQEGVPR